MRNIFVEAFLFIVVAGFSVWLFQKIIRRAANMSENAFEWFRKHSAAERIRNLTRDGSSAELVEVALALALAEYHWPKRLPDNDGAVAAALSRHRTHLQSMSLEELREWIDDRIRESHSVFLKTAAESLELNKAEALPREEATTHR